MKTAFSPKMQNTKWERRELVSAPVLYSLNDYFAVTGVPFLSTLTTTVPQSGRAVIRTFSFVLPDFRNINCSFSLYYLIFLNLVTTLSYRQD
ncbi:MAG: hypothetical protein LBG15_14960 [Dysgonamonadaceae bacterium]|nr:hypothetical protein [Dysgonamonadaceae bacterium]